jgi:hypothetical protein
MSGVSTRSGSDASTAINRRITRLEIELEHREAFHGYARLYGAVSVATLFLLFLPILEPARENVDGYTVVTPYGTLWEMAGDQSGDPAVVGILLAVGLIALTVFGAFRPRSLGLPIAIAVVAALIVLMLVVRPGTGDPEPGLTAEGNAGLALAVGVGILAIVHAVHYGRWLRSESPRR